MRHRINGHKLGKNSSQRMSMYKGLVAELLRSDKVVTTEAKAKRARVFAEKMISLAKRGGLHARRQALAFITDEEVINRAFADLAARYAERNGGYTRITKIGPRVGDCAPMVRLDLVT